MENLLAELKRRVEQDKEALRQWTALRKSTSGANTKNPALAARLLQFSRGCALALQFMSEDNPQVRLNGGNRRFPKLDTAKFDLRKCSRFPSLFSSLFPGFSSFYEKKRRTSSQRTNVVRARSISRLKQFSVRTIRNMLSNSDSYEVMLLREDLLGVVECTRTVPSRLYANNGRAVYLTITV